MSFCRTVHIYLSVLGLGVMLLFGITGLTINHEDWFGATTPHLSESEGQTPLKLIEAGNRLGVVEHLRSTFHINGAVTGYDDLGDRLAIGFKNPGQIWDVEIDKATGQTSVSNEAFNFTAIINNLHRGRYSGPAWKWLIDISAVLIVIACFTGVVLWLALPRRRRLGIAAMALGTVGLLVIYVMLVPGPDSARSILPPAPEAPAAGE